MTKILLVEDADTLREVLTSLLQQQGYEVHAYARAEAALSSLASDEYACILADYKLPGKNGLEFLKETREISPHVPFLIMTAYGSIDMAVTAMKLGANDFLTKPFEPETLSSILQEVIRHRRIINRNMGAGSHSERIFFTKHPRTQELLKEALKVAKVDSPVLILGESGTGKELIARYIHNQSPRASAPFVALNCSACPPDLLESEFFGHEAGAYTGATQKRIGIFEYASHGTIFLDEVGDMPPALQVKLLRVLQENEIKRIGSNKTIKVNPRIIAATNHVIEEALQSKQMREDFYYRISVIIFEIPPLRERPEDIECLVRNYIERFSSSSGKANLTITPEALRLLKTYHWPGNVRELENVIERAAILADDLILPQHLGINPGLDLQVMENTRLTLREIAAAAAQKAEAEIIAKTLRETRGNKAQTARRLGVSYKTLLSKVREYHLG